MLNLFFLNTITPTAADVTFVSQNIAASNLSPYEYKNKKNIAIIEKIYKNLEHRIMIMPEAKDDDEEKNKFDDLYQPLICAYPDETTLMSVNQQHIYDAIIKISTDSKNLVFPDFLKKYKIEGDDVFTDRPAVPFDAETLSTRLNDTKFGKIFVDYLKKAELENAPKKAKLSEKEKGLNDIEDKKSTEYINLKDEIDMLKDDIKTFETSKDKAKYIDASGKFVGTPKDVIAERIVLLFIYDYYFYVAAANASSTTKWLDEKTNLDGLMKNARNTAVSNILEKGYDLIALQEADKDDVLEKINVENKSLPVKYEISNFLTKKGKSSIIIYNKQKFELQNVIDLGDFRTNKGEAVCASLKCLETGKAVFVCSYHSGGDGLETPLFLDLISTLATNYEYVLIGLDGNVLLNEVTEDSKLKKLGFPMFSKSVADAKLTITFGEVADLTEDVEFANQIDPSLTINQIHGFSMARDITDNLVWLTTSKERSDLQTQRGKANKPDKNPKDHILSRGFEKTHMKIFNTHKDGKFEYVKNQRMPNETFAADHALIFGSFTPLKPEHQSIYPHSSASAEQDPPDSAVD